MIVLKLAALLGLMVPSLAASPFDNRIVYLETMRYRGRWAESRVHYPGWVHTVSAHQDQVAKMTNLKWKVTPSGEGDYVFLESEEKPHWYMDCNQWGTGLSYSSYPQNADWAKWRFVHVSGDVYRIKAKRWGDYLDASHVEHKVLHNRAIGIWSNWRVYTPPVKSSYEVVFHFHNNLAQPVSKTFEIKKGISTTHESTESVSITQELGFEIKSAVTSSTSFTAEWSNTKSETWFTENTDTTEVTVPAGKTVVVRQLVATYGPFTVRSTYTRADPSK